jgi:hypothetical protein|tara:strand:- start:587 stop:811 length:225 start_codon:yes stop_codon:yes gene_type:complete
MDKDMQPVMTIDADGDAVWHLNGLRHRTDGPAIEWADGRKSWCLHGTYLTFNDWLDQTPGLTNKQKTLYRLQYA